MTEHYGFFAKIFEENSYLLKKKKTDHKTKFLLAYTYSKIDKNVHHYSSLRIMVSGYVVGGYHNFGLEKDFTDEELKVIGLRRDLLTVESSYSCNCSDCRFYFYNSDNKSCCYKKNIKVSEWNVCGDFRRIFSSNNDENIFLILERNDGSVEKRIYPNYPKNLFQSLKTEVEEMVKKDFTVGSTGNGKSFCQFSVNQEKSNIVKATIYIE